MDGFVAYSGFWYCVCLFVSFSGDFLFFGFFLNISYFFPEG